LLHEGHLMSLKSLNLGAFVHKLVDKCLQKITNIIYVFFVLQVLLSLTLSIFENW
jgi:hypothetical protein